MRGGRQTVTNNAALLVHVHRIVNAFTLRHLILPLSIRSRPDLAAAEPAPVAASPSPRLPLLQLAVVAPFQSSGRCYPEMDKQSVKEGRITRTSVTLQCVCRCSVRNGPKSLNMGLFYGVD